MTAATQAQNHDAGTPGPEQMQAIKAKMKATWEAGDYDSFSRFMEAGAVEILNGWGILAGERLLDVGCGSGQTAIPAARAGAIVTGIDIAANLIEAARERAALDGVSAQFDEGDAEQLPYADQSFDRAISLIGAMFAPNADKVASEFARVLKPGANLHMANWTPQGMVGKMFKVVAGHVPPPPGVTSPLMWGDEETVYRRLAADFTDIELTRREYPLFIYPFSTTEVTNFFRQHFGPIHRAFGALDETGQKSLHQQLTDNYQAHNVASDGTTELRAEYLDVKARRK